MKRFGPVKTWLGGGLLLALALAGCGSPTAGGASSVALLPTMAPSPTQAPLAAPTLHSLALGDYTAHEALPGAAGIVLAPVAFNAGVQGQVVTALSFYRYNSHAVEQIAAPSASTQGIIGAAYGGDWVAYVVGDGKQTNWTLWLYNVTSGQRSQIDSASGEGAAEWAGSLLNNGADVVWVVKRVIPSNGPTEYSSALLDYSFASQKTQTRLSLPHSVADALAMNDSAMLLSESDESNGTSGLYLLPRGSSSPTQIAQQYTQGAAMNARYAVWEDQQQSGLILYDLQTGTMTSDWANCLQPAISPTSPYVVCSHIQAQQIVLARVPDGDYATFPGGASASSGVMLGSAQIYNGRTVFVNLDGSVQYFDLPTQ